MNGDDIFEPLDELEDTLTTNDYLEGILVQLARIANVAEGKFVLDRAVAKKLYGITIMNTDEISPESLSEGSGDTFNSEEVSNIQSDDEINPGASQSDFRVIQFETKRKNRLN